MKLEHFEFPLVLAVFSTCRTVCWKCRLEWPMEWLYCRSSCSILSRHRAVACWYLGCVKSASPLSMVL